MTQVTNFKKIVIKLLFVDYFNFFQLKIHQMIIRIQN